MKIEDTDRMKTGENEVEDADKIKVFSVFESVSGEVGFLAQGLPTIFVRLSGCNLGCVYCDSKKAVAEDSGVIIDVTDLYYQKIRPFMSKHVIITGGEPLLQEIQVMHLAEILIADGYTVSIETNGSIFPKDHKTPCNWIFDYKLPGSNFERAMMSKVAWLNIPDKSIIKFVCSNKKDFERALAVIRSIRTSRPGMRFALSSCSAKLPSKELFELMVKHDLADVVLNVQIHKYIFPDGETGDTEI